MHRRRAATAVSPVLVALVVVALVSGCTTEPGTPSASRTATGIAPAPSTPAPSTPAAVVEPADGGSATAAAKRPELDRALIRASGRGDTDRVAVLLARGASVRARDDKGRTALVAAAFGNHLAAAGLLVAAGADVNRQDHSRQSAYLVATSEVGDDPRMLELMLAHGADVRSLDSFDGTGLIRAADRGNVRIVRRLLRTDVRVDHVNNLGWTALLEAVLLGDGSRRYVRTVEALVEAGADVDKPSRRDGMRPLQHAQRRGFTRVAEVLRAAGAR